MRFNFKATGVSALSLVIAGVTQSGWTAFVASPGTTAAITNTLQPAMAAPMGSFFDVEVTGFDATAPDDVFTDHDPTKTDIEYYWTIQKIEGGVPASYTPTYSTPNIVTEHQNSAELYGPTVAHTFEAAGTYRASVVVYEPSSGKTNMAVGPEFTVADPDVFYAGAQTIYVHPTSDFSAAPAGAQTTTTPALAYDLADGNANPVRIMLADDQTYVVSKLESTSTHPSLLVCRSGGGSSKPIISLDYSLNSTRCFNDNLHDVGNTKSMTLAGLEFLGAWDATTETFSHGLGNDKTMTCAFHTVSGGTTLQKSASTAFFFMAHDCKVTKCKSSFAAVHTNTLLSNLEISNWHDYGVAGGDAGHYGIIGSRIEQHVNARSGGPKPVDGVTFTNNNHGPLRLGDVRRLFIDGCSMFSRNGWSSSTGGYRAEQPCIRMNTSGIHAGVCNIQRNRLEGGFVVVTCRGEGASTSRWPLSYLIERNEFVGSHATGEFVDITQGGVTVRNNHCLTPDTAQLYGNPLRFVLIADVGADNAASTDAPIRVYNNTFVSLMSPSNYSSPHDGSFTVFNSTYDPVVFTGVTEYDNIIHTPNATTPQVSSAPLTTSDRPDAKHLGYHGSENSYPAFPTPSATPVGSIKLYTPATGSNAIDGASTPSAGVYPPNRDFYGNERTSADVGAIEVV